MRSAVIVFIFTFTIVTGTTQAQWKNHFAISKVSGPAIISPSVPRDSRCETVYETQGKTQQEVPVVSGVLTQPEPIKMKYPKYPKAYKKEKKTGTVTIEGVVSEDGGLIDLKPADGSDPEFAKSALAAVEQYQFKPATLDGKAVAFRVKLDVQFRVF